ncbi:HAD family hydrolase [Metabacillus malikii]|uniref:Hydrolase of the HAD superfamily n=1 Tax=Metabacillus malikii TaxID=1504265 RepID=A0ABT9ZDQ8_9BACI|nr:HAD family hydrolase [Metabacillus malikii]MDQ0229385.1 putative hydrolase of the HAD superfamily [Metabacillus malikii]
MNKLINAEAIFFDLDDTIYDQQIPFQSAIDYGNIDINNTDYQLLYKRVRFHSDKLWKDYTAGTIDLDTVRIRRLIDAFQEFGATLTVAKAIEIQERYEYEQKTIKPFSKVISIINELQQQNKIVGLITNGPVEHQTSKIKALQLDRIIPSELIFISDGIGITKPDPRIFHYVQDQVKKNPENCYYIGDTWENDIEAALNAGWNAIWYNFRNRQPQSSHKPNKIITSYNEWSSLI